MSESPGVRRTAIDVAAAELSSLSPQDSAAARRLDAEAVADLGMPSILLMERYPDGNPIKRLFENIEADGNLKQAIEMIQNSDIIPQSYSMAADLCHKATQALEPLPDSSYKRSLVDLATYVMERRY